MTIIPILAFKDNYIWVIYTNDQSVWVVDPGDAAPVLSFLTQKNLNLSGILITHHHFDHTGGVAELVSRWPSIPVIGSHKSTISQITHRVKDQDEINCNGIRFKVLEIPGHTLDHIAFYNDEGVFCGDTLFSAGCGKVFEGTFSQMVQSLLKLRSLGDKTKIYCGHEYTLSNLRFAEAVEPANPFISKKIEQVKHTLSKNLPTLPSELSAEKTFNPFLRCQEATVIAAAEKYAKKKLHDIVDVFAVIRSWKNEFQL